MSNYYLRSQSGKYMMEDKKNFHALVANKPLSEQGIASYAGQAAATSMAEKQAARLCEEVTVVDAATLAEDKTRVDATVHAANLYWGTHGKVLAEATRLFTKWKDEADAATAQFTLSVSDAVFISGDFLRRAAERFTALGVKAYLAERFIRTVESARGDGHTEEQVCAAVLDTLDKLIDRLTSELVNCCGRHNSTCAWSNAERDTAAVAASSARQELVNLRSTIKWYVSAAHKSFKLIEDASFTLASATHDVFKANYGVDFDPDMLVPTFEGGDQ